MDNYKEYLNPKDHYLFVKWPLSKPVDPDWIEIPEGTEVIRMNCEGSLNFYAKINGHWAIKNKVDMENWYQPKPYSSHFDADDGSLPVIWKRPTQDPALISGREAWLAFFDGLHVQWSEIDREAWFNFKEEDWNTHSLKNDGFISRLKPQTIKVELELPKPFEPKVGEEVFYINDTNKSGYCVDEHQAHYNYNFGVWRTEDEIKQVVEQLRKIRGTNS